YWGHLWGAPPAAANEATAKVLVLDPRSEMGLHWRVAASLADGEWDEAAALIDRVLHFDPPIAEQMVMRWRWTHSLLARDREGLERLVAQLRSARWSTIHSVYYGAILVPGGLDATMDLARIL